MFNKYKNNGNQKGIISEELVHRIDSMNDEIINNDTLYQAQKKHTVQESKLFNENAYTDDMYRTDEEETVKDSSSNSNTTLILIVIVIILLGILEYLCFK